MRWLSRFCLLAALAAGSVFAADPLERNPHLPQVVVRAGWGDAPDEFAPRGDGWGVEEVGRFGAFALGPGGCLYIADEGSNTIKVYEPDGTFSHAVAMQLARNLVDDLAVDGDRICWLREWPGRPTQVFCLEPGADAPVAFAVSDDPDLVRDHLGRVYSANLSLVPVPGGLALYARQLSWQIPVVRDGRPLSPAEQQAGKRRGLATAAGGRLAQVLYPAVTLAGDPVPRGAVVRLNESGAITGSVTADPGPLVEANGDFFLTTRALRSDGQWLPYWILHDADGRELSRTCMPVRPDGLLVEVNNRVRLAADGSFFELKVDRDGVQVIRYDHAEEGRP